MSYQVLARKWRPQTFTDLVGQDHIASTLTNAIRNQRVGHAYLFVGTRGIGKTTSARIFAKALNCESPLPDLNPCGECTNCTEITRGSSIDVLEIDGASNNSVDDIRQIREGAQYTPARCPYKIFIIDEVHMLSNAAWNALLKTLEEPPPHIKFLFATTEVHRVLPTILSRCQRLELKAIPRNLIASRLSEICQLEQVSVEPTALNAIARAANGGMRDALSILDQMIAFCSGQEIINEKDVTQVFGLSSSEETFSIVAAMIQNRADQLIQYISDLAKSAKNLEQLYSELFQLMRDLMVIREAGENATQILDLDQAEFAQLAQLANQCNTSTLQRMLNGFLDYDGKIRHTLNKRIYLEVTLLRIMKDSHAFRVEDLIRRLQSVRETGELDALSAGLPELTEKKKLSVESFLTESTQSSEVATPLLQETSPKETIQTSTAPESLQESIETIPQQEPPQATVEQAPLQEEQSTEQAPLQEEQSTEQTPLQEEQSTEQTPLQEEAPAEITLPQEPNVEQVQLQQEASINIPGQDAKPELLTKVEALEIAPKPQAPEVKVPSLEASAINEAFRANDDDNHLPKVASLDLPSATPTEIIEELPTTSSLIELSSTEKNALVIADQDDDISTQATIIESNITESSTPAQEPKATEPKEHLQAIIPLDQTQQFTLDTIQSTPDESEVDPEAKQLTLSDQQPSITNEPEVYSEPISQVKSTPQADSEETVTPPAPQAEGPSPEVHEQVPHVEQLEIIHQERVNTEVAPHSNEQVQEDAESYNVATPSFNKKEIDIYLEPSFCQRAYSNDIQQQNSSDDSLQLGLDRFRLTSAPQPNDKNNHKLAKTALLTRIAPLMDDTPDKTPLEPNLLSEAKPAAAPEKEIVEIHEHPVWQTCLEQVQLDPAIVDCLKAAKSIYEGGEIFIVQIKEISDASDQLSSSDGMQEILRKQLAELLNLPKLKLHLLAEKKKQVVEEKNDNDATQNPVVKSMVEIFNAQVINVRART